MTTNNNPKYSRDSFSISFDQSMLQVSYLSSLLRILQATLREVGQTGGKTRQRFEQKPYPVLMMTISSVENSLGMEMLFADSSNSSILSKFSRQVFEAFLDRFSKYISDLPQPSLFGGAAPESSKVSPDKPLSVRMDQIHRELRRAGKVTIHVGERSIRIEGESMEIK
ncbi:uncharacterized protein METZ01_LOCUS473970 [marine metagenome]|uniref:Uncharacterized protein n=1 Tax=marine metagenome TaxID=408172 RepID=A0A383BLN8_9ZZZZ